MRALTKSKTNELGHHVPAGGLGVCDWSKSRTSDPMFLTSRKTLRLQRHEFVKMELP
jgi:hypothetical protein